MKDIIQEMADDIYKNSNYSEAMSLEIAKFNVKNNYRKCGRDIVILTKDEFHSMIKTDKEAEEYGQQCWNDGRALGQKEAVVFQFFEEGYRIFAPFSENHLARSRV